MTAKTFSSPEDLKASILEAPNVVKSVTSNSASQGNVSSSTMKRRTKQLISSIEQKISSYLSSYTPSVYVRRDDGIENGIFEGIVYNEANNVVEVRFAGNAWAPNVVYSDPHESFIPVLLNYGWSVAGDHGNRRSRYPTFEYYRGNRFISKSIEQFNRQCISENLPLRAKFIVNGMDAEILYGNGSIPYRR